MVCMHGIYACMHGMYVHMCSNASPTNNVRYIFTLGRLLKYCESSSVVPCGSICYTL